jgi:hypothetical protein
VLESLDSYYFRGEIAVTQVVKVWREGVFENPVAISLFVATSATITVHRVHRRLRTARVSCRNSKTSVFFSFSCGLLWLIPNRFPSHVPIQGLT